MSSARTHPLVRLMPLLAGIVILGWTIYFLTSGAVQAQPGWFAIAAWSMPVVLVIGVWLVVQRQLAAPPPSGRAAAGIGSALEARLAAIDRKLDAMPTRPAASLASGARDDEALAQGRLENLRAHAERFRVEMETREQDNLAAIRRRADELAKSLSAQDIALRRDAGQAMDELQARFKSLREENLRLSGEFEKIQSDALRGWDRAVAELETRMKETAGKIIEVDRTALDNAATRLASLHDEAERIDVVAVEKLQAFEAEMARRRDDSMARAASALAGIEEQIAGLDTRLDERRDAAMARATGSLRAIEELIAGFDKRMDERRAAQLARVAELGERSEVLAARMAEIDGTLAGHVEQFEGASAALASFTGDLSGRLAESRALIETSGQVMGEMADASTRMFEQIRASADFSSKTIPAALADAESKILAFEQRAAALRDAIGEVEDKSSALAANLEKARAGVPISTEALDGLGKRLDELAAKSDALAQHTRTQLRDAIVELENSTTGISARLREGQEKALGEFAATFGARSMEAIGSGLKEQTEAAITQLQQTSQDAGKAGLATLSKLRLQITELETMAGNLEARIADSRQQAQDEPNRDFSIEMTKITEKLNGAALDITKVFDANVPDPAWQAYLRGDYGIFTRKAVRLLSSEKADAIYEAYRGDAELREIVNRYVADFESMLRVVMATRNGHQLAVTLLSSDIGKIYVALAQATERLRQ